MFVNQTEVQVDWARSQIPVLGLTVHVPGRADAVKLPGATV